MFPAVFAALPAVAEVTVQETRAPFEWVGALLIMACPLALIVALLVPLLLANARQRQKSYSYMEAAARHNEKTLELLEEIRGELRTLNERLTRLALGGQQDTVVQPTDVTARRPNP